jgi:ABC-type transporter Mla MlaB component
MATPRRTIACDVGELARPDAGTIDALARLALTTRRLGHEIGLQRASEELAELLALAGLSEVLGGEPRGQTEEGEERVGVQEERQLDDPSG